MEEMNKEHSTKKSQKSRKTLSWALENLSNEEREAVKAALCRIGEEILSGAFHRPDGTPPV